MPGILLKNDSGGLKFEAHDGETLLSALGRAGVPVAAPCGGKRRCGKCKVKILEGRVRDISPGETSFTDEDLPPDIVLACRSIPETDITLSLVSENAYDGGAYQSIGTTERIGRISRAAVALDIGTTTVSACLVDLDTGREAELYSALNQQRIFGADVMSRIGAAREGKTGELFSIIQRQTAEILSGFMVKFNLSSIETLIVSANTTMLHLFVNENPSMMGEVPFTPVFLEGREYSGKKLKDLGLTLPVEKVFLFSSISAFVGGDIVSGLASINILEMKETVFFIDIGTNGEMALFHEGKIYCASAAAGPALEGAEISCGVGSIKGAINKVEWKDGAISWNVIGSEGSASSNENPVGICGCGLIDAVALMLEQGIIDETGAFADDSRKDFQIAPGISITGRDIRQFQLAKGAILSGIGILCKRAGVALDEIKKVYVAGGLGFYIDQKSAIKAGLLPVEFLDRITVCGNASLKGAVKALSTPDFFEYCKFIQEKSVTVELASDPEFMDAFAENMIFP